MTERESFGPTLRRQRERRGLTLEAVAESTKVSPFLLTSLERSDVSRWPLGIYRRSFLRVYAEAIGLPPEDTLREFLRLFPEPGQAPPSTGADTDGPVVRITLMPEPRWRSVARQTLIASLDIVAVIVLAAGAVLLSGGSAWTILAIVALGYFTAGTALLGRSPAARYFGSLHAGPARPSSAADLAGLRRTWTAGWMPPAKSAPKPKTA